MAQKQLFNSVATILGTLFESFLGPRILKLVFQACFQIVFLTEFQVEIHTPGSHENQVSALRVLQAVF